jgi:uncharacterized Zn-finger protein
VFRNIVQINEHMRRAHKTPSIICPQCGKKSKDNQAQTQHMKIHTDKSVPKRNPISTLKRSQQYAQAKEDVENKIKHCLKLQRK